MLSRSPAKNQITEGVIWKQLLFFFFPILLGTLFQQLYNTADTIVVGRFVGTDALASVGGSTGQIVNLVVNFFVGLSSGATVIIARFYGAGNRWKLNNALHTAIALSITGCIITAILGILLTPSILEMMQTPADVIGGSIAYLRIYFAGIIFVFVYNIGSGILRAVGDSKRPLYFLMVCCFLNIGLDILFVVLLHLGIKGAAYATVISQAVSALLVLLSLGRSTDIYRLRPRKIRFHRSLLISIITIGLPAGIQSVMYSISNIIIQTSLNSLGTETVAAHTAFTKIDAIYWMISGAFSVSIITFIGQNFGARKFDRMKKSIKVCLLMDLAASGLCDSFHSNASDGALSAATVYHRPQRNRNRDANHPYHRTFLYGIYFYRNSLQLSARHGKCAGPHAHDLRRCLRTSYPLDLPFCAAASEHFQYPAQLSHFVGIYRCALYRLLPVLSEEILPETGGSFGGRNHSLKIQELKLFFFKNATAFLFHNQNCHGGL